VSGSSAAETSSPSSRQSPGTVSEVIAAFRKAAGDQARLKVRTFVADGVVDHSPRTHRCPYGIRFSRPNQFLVYEREMAIPELGPKGQPKVFALAKGLGWLLDGQGRAMGAVVPQGRAAPPDPKPAVARREVLRVALGMVPDLMLESSIVSFVAEGKATRDGKSFNVLAVADEIGPFGKLYFDPSSGLPSILEYRFISNIPRPTEYVRAVHYEDFRDVSGIKLPFSMRQEKIRTPEEPGGGLVPGGVVIERYVVNQEIEARLFVNPGASQIETILPDPKGSSRPGPVLKSS
jgi:hypothetical protein